MHCIAKEWINTSHYICFHKCGTQKRRVIRFVLLNNGYLLDKLLIPLEWYGVDRSMISTRYSIYLVKV